MHDHLWFPLSDSQPPKRHCRQPQTNTIFYPLYIIWSPWFCQDMFLDQHLLLILDQHYCQKYRLNPIPTPKPNPSHNLFLKSAGNYISRKINPQFWWLILMWFQENSVLGEITFTIITVILCLAYKVTFHFKSQTISPLETTLFLLLRHRRREEARD